MSRLIGSACLVLLGLLLVVGLGQSDAQEKKFKGMLPPGWRALKLSPEQVQKIYKIQAENKAKVEELEQQILELKGQGRAEMLKVLNDEQRATLFGGEVPKSAPKKKPEPQEEK